MIIAYRCSSRLDLNASSEEDAKTVASLDTKYQAAVKSNDVATMDQILADDFVLVTGRGKVFSKADLIESARKKEVTYERSGRGTWNTESQSVGRHGSRHCSPLDQGGAGRQTSRLQLWFSDTYVRTPQAGDTFLARLPCHCPKRSPSTHADRMYVSRVGCGVAPQPSFQKIKLRRVAAKEPR